MAITIIFAVLAVLSLTLTLWQWAVAIRFPLHQCAVNDSWVPAVTLLKPLKGLDVKTAGCLESWLAQEYKGEVEVLFGVASAEDPVCQLVRDLVARHPKAKAQLLICPEDLGANAKVSTLMQLMRLARHELIIVSDADVWVPEGFLGQIVAPLEDPAVGLVNCFYRMGAGVERQSELRVESRSAPGRASQPSTHVFPNSQLRLLSTFAMRWEAFSVNADFWSQVLQSQTLKPLDFALGAVMATTREQVAKIGGFEALADHLADDYQLGHQIARSGGRIALATVVVECRNAPTGWREVWTHQIRWARTIRVCQPVAYFFSQLHNATLWPWLWALWQPVGPVLGFAGICLLTRMAAALYCARKLTRRADVHSLWLAPMKDLLQTVIWALAFFGGRIEWRGRRFRVKPGGKLVKC